MYIYYSIRCTFLVTKKERTKFMENIKQYEAAVIRRVCYMANAYNKDSETLSKDFYFTNKLSFDKWYEKNKCDSWILSSFYKFYKLFFESEAELRTEVENIKRMVLIPFCEATNELIDKKNGELKYYFSDQFITDNAIETLTRNGYSYDYAQNQAKTFVNDSKYRAQVEDSIKKQYIEPFEQNIKNMNKDITIDVSELWLSASKQYRHATPNDFFYYDLVKVRVTDDILDLKGVVVQKFEEYQYILAIKSVFDSYEIKIEDHMLNSVTESARRSNLMPKQNENGLPGANWDILQTVLSENSNLKEDIISLVHYCANNKEPNIKESWLFQYADVLPIDQSEEQKENENLLVQTAKWCSDYHIGFYLRSIVALAKCVQMNILYSMGKALGGNAEPPQTVAEMMESLRAKSDYFKSEDDKKFLSDLIKIMKSDGIELDTTGMKKFIGKEGMKSESDKKIGWKCMLVGGKRTAAAIFFVIIGIESSSLGVSSDESGEALMTTIIIGIGICIYAWGVIKNIIKERRNK